MRCSNVRQLGREPITSQNRAAGLKLLLRAVALGALLVSFVSAQYLEATIMLPDTLGPLNGPYCVACTDDSAFPRLYIGGAGGFYPGRPPEDSGGVIVAEALTCKRLARIPTGPVKSLCYVPTHNKLYVASLTSGTVNVVDCATNQVVSAVRVASEVPVMQYNSQNDRLYCGGTSITVIDCAADTVVHTVPVGATAFALDTSGKKLYAGVSGPLSVIDCAADSIVAIIPQVDSAGALCYNPTANKVYATTRDTLFAIRTADDSIVARIAFSGLTPLLACDPLRNRAYCHYGGHWSSIDCAADTVLFSRSCGRPSFIACDVARNRLYIVVQYTMWVNDASSGEVLAQFNMDSWPNGACWCPGLDRFFSLPCYAYQRDYLFQTCLTMSIDCGGDSMAGVIPLTLWASIISVDSVHNRLYFMYQSSLVGAVGAADCARNIVTSFAYAGEEPGPMCYNPNNNHLYWITGDYRGVSIAFVVLDCSTGTVVKRFPLSGWVEKLQLNVGLNKLYAEAFESTAVAILVIDGLCDSVVKRIAVPSGSQVLRLVPEDNVLWSLCVHHVVAIDCLGDSILVDAPVALRSIDDAICCREDRKIYTSYGQVIDMDDPAHVESIPLVASRFCHVPDLHKLYANGQYGIYVIDTRSDSVIGFFNAPCSSTGLCLSHTGDYIYCAGYADSTTFVIDVRGDSVVSTFEVPIYAAARDPFSANRLTNRIYEAAYDDRFCGAIPVIRDSAPIGLEELKPTELKPCVGPTLVNRGVPLHSATPSELFDASGRRVADLWRGLNNISHLAPGIYFLREEPQPSSHTPQTVRKVVIAR